MNLFGHDAHQDVVVEGQSLSNGLVEEDVDEEKADAHQPAYDHNAHKEVSPVGIAAERRGVGSDVGCAMAEAPHEAKGSGRNTGRESGKGNDEGREGWKMRAGRCGERQ